jgi:hypothetical protein
MRNLIPAMGMLLVCAAASCGDISVGPHSATVGAACTTSADCATQCLLDDRHFPGGMCTVPCASDADCPHGSVCLDTMSGICVTACARNEDCAGFGRGFVCDSSDGIGGAAVSICRVP